MKCPMYYLQQFPSGDSPSLSASVQVEEEARWRRAQVQYNALLRAVWPEVMSHACLAPEISWKAIEMVVFVVWRMDLSTAGLNTSDSSLHALPSTDATISGLDPYRDRSTAEFSCRDILRKTSTLRLTHPLQPIRRCHLHSPVDMRGYQQVSTYAPPHHNVLNGSVMSGIPCGRGNFRSPPSETKSVKRVLLSRNQAARHLLRRLGIHQIPKRRLHRILLDL
jgi:hypothetical protein